MAQETIENINKISNRFNEGAAPVFSMRVDGVSRNLQDAVTNNASFVFDVTTNSQDVLLKKNSGLTSVGNDKHHEIKTKAEKDAKNTRDAVRSAKEAIRQAYEQERQLAIQDIEEAKQLYNEAPDKISSAIDKIQPEVDEIKARTQTIGLNGREYVINGKGQYAYLDKNRNEILETDEDTVNTLKSKHAEMKTNGGQLRNTAEQSLVMLHRYLMTAHDSIPEAKQDVEQLENDIKNGKFEKDPQGLKNAREGINNQKENIKHAVREADKINNKFDGHLKNNATAVLKHAVDNVAAASEEKVVEQLNNKSQSSIEMESNGYSDFASGEADFSPANFSTDSNAISNSGIQANIALSSNFKTACQPEVKVEITHIDPEIKPTPNPGQGIV